MTAPVAPGPSRGRVGRKAAVERKRSGASLGARDAALARFTVADLFAEPEIRRRVVLACLMSLATNLAWWGIGAISCVS
jgi:hypothetical protein